MDTGDCAFHTSINKPIGPVLGGKVKMKCYHCGATEYNIIAQKEQIRFECYGYDKQVLECRFCGLIQLQPQWVVAELDMLYETYSRKEDFKGQKRKVKISKYLKKYMNKRDYILEVGCGYGDNLNYLRDKGFRVTGIDKDPTNCTGFPMINKGYEEYTLLIKQDVIYAIHLLEHLPDPRGFIVWMLRNLTDRGKFILEIPSIDDPLLRLYNSKAYQKFCWYPYHLFFYSKDTAEQLFQWYPHLKLKFILRQEYGLLNHLRWLLLRRPGNVNFHIPVLDDIYKKIMVWNGLGDTLVIVGEKCSI